MMRLRGVFLGSTVGRRFLALFLLAASLPVALLTWLSSGAVSSTVAAANDSARRGEAHAAALLTLERLRHVQVNLATLTESRASGVVADMPPSASGLRAFAPVGLRGEPTVVIDAVDGRALRDLLATRTPVVGRDALWVVPLRATREAALVVAHRSAETGTLWVGQIDTEWLWRDMDAQPSGMWVCAYSGRDIALYCSGPAGPQEAARVLHDNPAEPAAAGTVSVKSLFLGGDFAADDWQFVVGQPTDAGLEGAWPPAHALVPAAAAALLLAALLSMWQIRRSLIPLGRLADAARGVAARRHGTRIQGALPDEFGVVGRAFDDMAAQVERQFDELAALAAIDRAVVADVDVDRALGLVLGRLARVLPGRAVWVARLTAVAPAHLRGASVGAGGVGKFDVPLGAQAITEIAAAADGLPAGPLLRAVLQPLGAASAALLPVTWRGKVCGLIALTGTLGDVESEALREVLELRDRIAAALAAAEREEHLVHKATHDILTGLPNRAGLQAAIEQTLANGDEDGDVRLAILFIDIDRFKSVNDNHGHAFGDSVLQLAAKRVRACLPAHAVLARPAGDEFVVVLRQGGDDAAAVADRVCAAMAAPFGVGPALLFLGASIGIALALEHGDTAEALLRAADIAMYQSKRRGGSCFTLFDGQLGTESRRRSWIERDLRGAAERGELHLVYQPRVDAHDGRVRSAEALLRWNHPTRGPCPPGQFIPIAEESDLIETLGLWVVDAACAQVSAWRAAGVPPLRVAINVSARQLRSDRLERHLAATMRRLAIEPASLEVEITESVLVDNLDLAIAMLGRLRALGITVALDDFGTGYSSLASLRRLPIDVMKIDRAFVIDLALDSSAQSVARTIVALAGALNKRIVAEGVETPAQARWLRELGCDELQGFLYSRPVDPDALVAFVASAERHDNLLHA